MHTNENSRAAYLGEIGPQIKTLLDFKFGPLRMSMPSGEKLLAVDKAMDYLENNYLSFDPLLRAASKLSREEIENAWMIDDKEMARAALLAALGLTEEQLEIIKAQASFYEENSELREAMMKAASDRKNGGFFNLFKR